MSVGYLEFSEIMQDVFAQFPVIDGIFDKNGEEYILRQHTEDDAERYFNFYNMPEIAKFLPDGLVFKTIDDAKNEINYRRNNFFRKETIYWCVARKANNQLVGGCGFLDWSRYNRRIEIAYDLMPSYQNRGVISAAVRKLTAFAFLRLKVVRLGATTPTDNENSINLLTKRCNFKFEGTLCSYKFWKNHYIDVNHFSIDLKTFANLCQNEEYNFLTADEINKIKELRDAMYR